MRKFTNFLLIAITSSLLLVGCKEETPTINSSDIGLDEEKSEVSTEVTTEEVIESNEGKIRSQVTNEWIDEELLDQRPISVTFPNDSSALPHYSISNAGVLYQFPVEGKISRLLGIIDEWQDLEKIGNVRSTREYFVYAGLEWDPLYCHFGNPFYADPILAEKGTDNIDGTVAQKDVFYRSTDRPAPQNAYLSGDGIRKGADDKGYSLTYTNNYIPDHFTFATTEEEVDLSEADDSVDASTIDFASTFPIDKVYVEFNTDTNEYERFQYGKEHIDEANNQQLSFKNIIVQEAFTRALDDNGYLAMGMHDSGNNGYYFTNGKGIPITWDKPITNNFAPTKYFNEAGEEITINTGKTMIFVVPEDSSYSFY